MTRLPFERTSIVPGERERTVPNRSPKGTKKNRPQSFPEQYDDLKTREQVKAEKAEEDHIDFLDYLLSHYRYAFEARSKKHPDALLTSRQMRMVDELLTEIREIFKDVQGSEYLKPAISLENAVETAGQTGKGTAAKADKAGETPDTYEIPEEKRLTVSEIQILLLPYVSILHEYNMHRLWYRQG